MSSRKKIGKLRFNPGCWGMKPEQAFWYGFNDSWIFCNLLHGWDGFEKYLYEVVMDESQVLKISNVKEFDEFHAEFQSSLFAGLDVMAVLPGPVSERMLKSSVDWGKVSKKYGAVEIYPYLDARRFDSWFYAWDCASGVVLKEGVIKELRPFAIYDSETQQYIRHSVYNKAKTK